jgi:hypothetical protein
MALFGFKPHKYRGSEQVQQQKNAFFCITQRYVEINCSGYSCIIQFSHFSFITTPGIFLRLAEILGDVMHLELP